MTRVCATLALVGFAGCNAAPAPPPVVWQGEHLRYRTDDDVERVCAGTFRYLDTRVAHLLELFAQPDKVIDYAWVPGGQLAEYCPSTLGCAKEAVAFSKWVAHEHELTHALRAPPSHRALEEGIGVAFGEHRVLPGEVTTGDIEAMLRDAGRTRGVADGNFPRLGHFVSYLRAEYGMDTLAALDNASSIDDGYGRLAADFEGVVGEPLATAIADYELRYPICETTRYRYDGVECSDNPLPGPVAATDRIEITVPIGCDDDATIGPQQGKVWKTVAVEVPADGRHLLSVYARDGLKALIWITECDGSCFDVENGFFEYGTSLRGLVRCLRQGVHLVRVEVDAEDEGSFNIELTRFDFETCG